jgi:hypothetical protein
VSLNSGEYVSRFGGWTDQSGNQTSYGDTRLALGPPGGYRMYAGQTMEISIAADVPLDGWLFAELDAAAGPDRVLVKAPRVCAALMRSTKGCKG